MTDNSPQDRYGHSRDLLRSLHDTIRRLRNQAEQLRHDLEKHGIEALDQGERQQIAKLDSLVRDCQKVEKTLAEQTQSAAPEDSGLDLDTARAEISRRLDRLRAAAAEAELSGQPE